MPFEHCLVLQSAAGWFIGIWQTTAALYTHSAVIGTIRAKPPRLGLRRLQGKTAGPEISAINRGGVYTALSLRGPVFIQSTACVRADSCKCGHSQRLYELF